MGDDLKAALAKKLADIQQRGQDIGNQINPPPTAEDETKPANSLGNYAIDKLGMPKEWMQSSADQKRAYNNLPMQMGMGSMGTVGNVENGAEQALNKLASAKQMGQKLSAGEEYLLSKFSGKVPVTKTLEEASNAFPKLKGWIGK